MTKTKKAVTGRKETTVYLARLLMVYTVDTGEGVGVDWRSIASHRATTQLTLSVVSIVHKLIRVLTVHV